MVQIFVEKNFVPGQPAQFAPADLERNFLLSVNFLYDHFTTWVSLLPRSGGSVVSVSES